MTMHVLIAQREEDVAASDSAARRITSRSTQKETHFPRNFMHPFATYVLRSYYKATGWNEDNLFSNLTRSSNGGSLRSIPRLWGLTVTL